MAGTKSDCKPHGNAAQKVMVNRILAVDSLIREGKFPNAALTIKDVTSCTIDLYLVSYIF
jgi:hypothetical protein